MSWLAKLAPFRRGGLALAEAGADGGIDGAGRRETSGPPLICLINDASGRVSFKTHTFTDVEAATDFVLYWFPNQSEGGIIAFWAMTHEPSFGLDDPSESAAEPLVMIRDVTRDGVVYLFSFSEIDSAQAFLRDEVRHGTDLGSMMLYWAVPVRMAADPWGKMMLTPSAPPGTEREMEAQAPVSDIWSPPPATPEIEIPRADPVVDSRDVFEEAPNARTGVAEGMDEGNDSFELTAWMERARQKPAHERKAAADWSREMSRAVRKPKAKARFEPPFDETPAASQPLEPTVEATATPVVREEHEESPRAAETPPTIAEEPPAVMEPVVEAAIEKRAAVADSVEGAPVAEEAVVEEAPVVEATPAVEVTPLEVAAEETEPEEAPAAPVEAPAEDNAKDVQQATIRIHTNGNGHKNNGRVVEEHDSVELMPAEVVPETFDAKKGQFVERRAKPNGRRAGDAPERRRAKNGADATAEASTHAAKNANGSDETVEIRIDIHLESSRAMKVKRWEVKEEPFEGFNSPPGRF